MKNETWNSQMYFAKVQTTIQVRPLNCELIINKSNLRNFLHLAKLQNTKYTKYKKDKIQYAHVLYELYL